MAAPATASITPRLKERYHQEVVPELQKEFNLPNIMMVPRLTKVVLNMGVGDAQQDPRLLEAAQQELALISGQKAAIRRAKRSIAGFKVREGARIACMVTLRGDRMWEFVDRLFNVAIPRIRDFRGISPRSFDAQGNFTLGIREQTIFPEVDIDQVPRVRGMNVTFVIDNSHSHDESRELLRKLGMPFRR
jgi:large subunit ribosomal protein L5